MRKFALSVCVVMLSAGTLAWADEHEQEGQAPAMSAEQQAMMEAWGQAAAVGEAHQRLTAGTGEWKAVTRWWMDPNGEPMASESTFTREAVLGGRVVEDHWRGNFMGEEFIGEGRTGYNNVTGKYWSTWTDNMSTAVMVSHGEYDAENDQYVFLGDYVDPMTGETITTRTVITYPEEGQELMTMYETRGDDEIRTMEIHATKI